ncbi:hypothetical protein SAMN04489761_2810 [Tenacibaculum sp. MAR_2009_124]|uniref:hypothetical protein n=1 Tax=Tenacibaculum sp. MAR_2009_124 TaxID=1250059 RepID=UPI00089AABDA|nr:hypothetical protein [Tenacibaculum sp. MAR_2009_124]SEC37311.1 hypothetical protein SAMN04489761_2810 [Tenacibaculum sp. MAR_2009_124]
MKQSKETLKQFFETGDKPTQQQYSDLIDSYIDAKQMPGEPNRRFMIDENGDVSVATGGGVSGDFVTTNTDQEITGTKTIKASLYTEYIQSNSHISAAQNITSGGRVRTGGNALDFTESGNTGSATIKADIVGSTIHTLQGKSGTIAHLSDIPKDNSVVKTAKVLISAAELETNQVKTIIPAQGANTIIDILSVNSVFNFNGTYYGDAYLEFNQGIMAVSLADVNTYNYVVKTSQGSQESRSIPVNTDFTAQTSGVVSSGNDGVTVYVTYRVITTDGYGVAVVM